MRFRGNFWKDLFRKETFKANKCVEGQRSRRGRIKSKRVRQGGLWKQEGAIPLPFLRLLKYYTTKKYQCWVVKTGTFYKLTFNI